MSYMGYIPEPKKNWKRSGSGSADVEDFWDYSKKDNKEYHWYDVYYLHRLHVSGEFVDVTKTLVDAIPQPSVSDTSTGGDMSCIPEFAAAADASEESEDTPTDPNRQWKRSRSTPETSLDTQALWQLITNDVPSPSPVPSNSTGESEFRLAEEARKVMCQRKGEEAAELCISIQEEREWFRFQRAFTIQDVFGQYR
eukprot:745962-Hanusia_phi.AAC.2